MVSPALPEGQARLTHGQARFTGRAGWDQKEQRQYLFE